MEMKIRKVKIRDFFGAKKKEFWIQFPEWKDAEKEMATTAALVINKLLKKNLRMGHRNFIILT
jgi:hypothetical protein